jgi:hypothetical protein
LIGSGDFKIASHTAGIGSSYALKGLSSVNSLTITNGTFDLNSENGAAIGSGYGYLGGVSSVSELVISGGVFNLTSRNGGAALGTGYGYDGGVSSVGNLTILGGRFNAAGSHSSGIGAGNSYSGSASISFLGVRNATIFSNATGGAAVGATNHSRVRLMVLENSRVHAVSSDGPAIGAGVDNVTLLGGEIITSGTVGITSTTVVIIGNRSLSLTCNSISTCVSAASVATVGSSPITGLTNATTFFNATWRNDSAFAAFNFWGQYTGHSVRDSFGRARVLHIGNFARVAAGADIKIQWTGGSATYPRTAEGIAVSVPKAGKYQLSAGGVELCYNTSKPDFVVGADGESFYAEVEKCRLAKLSIVGIAVAATVVVLIIIAIVVLVFCVKKESQEEYHGINEK